MTMRQMRTWPDQPTELAHDSRPLRGFPLVWKIDNGGVATCSHCGSLHPETFYETMLLKPSSIELADMKYGWPHKFYVRWADRMGVPQQRKWYNLHLRELNADTFGLMTHLIEIFTGVGFTRPDLDDPYTMAWGIAPKPISDARIAPSP